MKNTMLAAGALLILLSACKKEGGEVEIIEPGPSISYAPVLTTGSWWVYQCYQIDSSGNETMMSVRDSVYVVGDTIINGETYIHREGTILGSSSQLTKYYRDSAGWILSPTGSIRYTYVSFNDTLKVSSNPLTTSHSIMKDPSGLFSTPAGIFEYIEKETHDYNTDGTPFSPCDSVFIARDLYAPNLGKIHTKFGYYSQISASCTFIERRLVDYYIK